MGQALGCLFSDEIYNTTAFVASGSNITVDLHAQPVTARNMSLWLLEDQTNGQLINTWTLLLQYSNSSEYYPVHTDTGIGHKRILGLELAPGADTSVGDVIQSAVPDDLTIVGLRVQVTAEFASVSGQAARLRSMSLFSWDDKAACV